MFYVTLPMTNNILLLFFMFFYFYLFDLKIGENGPGIKREKRYPISCVQHCRTNFSLLLLSTNSSHSSTPPSTTFPKKENCHKSLEKNLKKIFMLFNWREKALKSMLKIMSFNLMVFFSFWVTMGGRRCN